MSSTNNLSSSLLAVKVAYPHPHCFVVTHFRGISVLICCSLMDIQFQGMSSVDLCSVVCWMPSYCVSKDPPSARFALTSCHGLVVKSQTNTNRKSTDPQIPEARNTIQLRHTSTIHFRRWMNQFGKQSDKPNLPEFDCGNLPLSASTLTWFRARQGQTSGIEATITFWPATQLRFWDMRRIRS